MIAEKISFEEFVLQMKIPHVSAAVCETLSRSFKGDLNEFFSTARLGFNFALLKGIDERTNSSISKWVNKRTTPSKWKEEYEKAFNDTVPSSAPPIAPTIGSSSPISGKQIAVTGAVPGFSRGDVEARVSRLGGKVHSAVNRNTDYVVVADITRDTVKLKEARRLGIPTVSAQDFSKWL